MKEKGLGVTGLKMLDLAEVTEVLGH